jgi:pentapeptide repeat protein
MTERRATPYWPLANILDRLLEHAIRRESPSFRDLAKAAALDPALDFVGASLCDLDFRKEDLRGFDFSNADLSGADFRGANVEGVCFQGAKLDGAIGLPDKIGTMAWIIIVASSDGDQLEMLMEGAQKIAAAIDGNRSSVLAAMSVEEVRKRRNAAIRRDQLLIVQAALPSRDSSTNPEVLPGLELIKSIAREPKSPACILVSEYIEHLRIVQSIERCELLRVNASTDYVSDCLQLAKKLKVVASGETAMARGGPSPESDEAPAASPLGSVTNESMLLKKKPRRPSGARRSSSPAPTR